MASHSNNPFRAPGAAALSPQPTGTNPFLSPARDAAAAAPVEGGRPWDDGAPDSDSDDERAPEALADAPTDADGNTGRQPPPLPARTNTLAAAPTSPTAATTAPPLPARRETATAYAPPPGPPPAAAPRPQYAPPPGPPPAPRQDSLGPPPGSPSDTPVPELPAELQNVPHAPDDLPPAYSSTANARTGEETIDLGPRRPFTRAPPQPARSPQPYQPPQPNEQLRPEWQRAALAGAAPPRLRTPQPNESLRPEWQRAALSARGASTTAARAGSRSRTPQPNDSLRPDWQQNALARPRAASASGPTPPPGTPLSDFARDFYAAGSGPREGAAGASGGSGGSEGPRYAPPPGPPPASAGGVARSPTSASRSPGGAAAGASASAATRDATPTTVPTPGRPLLNEGYTLEYPAGHVCDRCSNTGYKSYDPSNPCRRCWRKYSKPFNQLLALAPYGQPGSRYQRPLPNFTSPRGTPGIAPPRTPSSAGASAPEHRRAVSSSAASPSPAPTLSRVVTMAPGQRAPPGATQMRAGDPRLGGRLCWRCSGRGWHSFMIFDEVTCEECGGLGRTGVQALGGSAGFGGRGRGSLGGRGGW